MLLPANFKSVIADTFYDKDIEILATTTSSTDGWVSKTPTTVSGTFKANVQFNKLGEIQSELGLTEQIDVSVTCDTSVNIEVGDLFQYNGTKYKATAVLPRDSHLLIAGQKWA